jgi:hypothetical protein
MGNMDSAQIITIVTTSTTLVLQVWDKVKNASFKCTCCKHGEDELVGVDTNVVKEEPTKQP